LILRALFGLRRSRLPGLRSLVFTGAVALLLITAAKAQEEPAFGSIRGTVSDSSGTPLPGIAVKIDSKVTDTQATLTTDRAGKYESAPLKPGPYTIRIEVRNYKNTRLVVNVGRGQTVNGSRQLIPINPGAPTVERKVAPEEVAELPIDGRDVLNTAQFEPGVIIQDGRSLEPTKTGYFALAINKTSGLASLNTLDGIGLTDETKGGTLQNVAVSSVQEVAVSRSMPNIATGLTSSGTVQMTSGSGSNDLHGEGFGLFRDDSILFAKAPGGQDLSFQRSDFGGRFGGALIKDKAFFFLSGEHVKQDARSAVVLPAPFQSLTGSFSSPFRNTSADGKLDWHFSNTTHAFYRFAYNWNNSVDHFGDNYSIYQNRNNSPSHAVGLDLTHGEYIHSFRFGYLQFHNSLQDATGGSNPLGSLPVNLRFSDLAGGGVQFGASPFAPQETLQRNLEFRYDGSRTKGDHSIHFGGSVNRITAGGYAVPYGIAPQVTTKWAGGIDANPLNYPVLFATLSNGQGFATERSGFGFPQGGQEDTRLQGYFGDSFRALSNLTLTFGVHYVRDTGRVDSDLERIPCSAANPAIPAAFLPCTGNNALLDQFGPAAGHGLPVSQPNSNFAPQFGFAWDPYRNGKTVIRGGAGVFYDNSLFTNVRLDRPTRLSQGLYSATNALTCAPGAAPGTVAVYFPTAGGLPAPIRSIDGLDLATQVCGQPVGTVATAIEDLQTVYQSAVAAAGASGNPNFVGNTLSLSAPVNDLAAFAPDYRTPRSYQINVGLQREMWGGGVLTLDYVRNVSQRFGLIVDTNRVGDANHLYEDSSGIPTAALNAITNTILQKAPACMPAGNTPISAGALSQTAISCYISNVPNANINDFAVNGLDSGTAFLGGMPATVGVQVAAGRDPRNFGAAFPGINALMGQGEFQSSIGQSNYDGLQISLKQNVPHEFFVFRGGDLHISYTFSKFTTNGGDNPTESTVAHDFRNAALYRGPSPLDRRHQLSVGWTLESRWRARLAFIGRFATAAPLLPSMLVPSGNPQATPGEIFRTDFTGDGLPGDLFPLRPPGSFKAVSSSTLASDIASYNSSTAGALTPAGQALVTANLFTRSQLATLRGTAPFIVTPPAGQFSNESFKSLDAAISWPFKLGERVRIEPSARLYNVFNFANFYPLSAQLAYYFPGPFQPAPAGAGSANGTPSGSSRDVLRTSSGSGVFNYGAPRQMEFGIKIDF
jgi:hypothetical protein